MIFPQPCPGDCEEQVRGLWGATRYPGPAFPTYCLCFPLLLCPWQTHVASLVSTKKEKKKNLREDAWRVWREIDDGTLAFKRVEEEVECRCHHSDILPS